MRHEILKKTALYRTIAFGLGLLIPYLMTGNLGISLIVGGITEIITVANYYIFEVLWRKYVERRRIKEGTSLLSIADSKVSIAYNVIKDLGEGKLIIEVISD